MYFLYDFQKFELVLEDSKQHTKTKGRFNGGNHVNRKRHGQSQER